MTWNATFRFPSPQTPVTSADTIEIGIWYRPCSTPANAHGYSLPRSHDTLLLSGYKAAAAQACVRWGAIRCAGKRLYRRTLSLCAHRWRLVPRVGTGTVDGRCYVTSSLRRDRANNGAEKEPNFLGRVLLAAADVTAALKEDDHKLQKRTAMSHVGGRVKIRTQVGLSVGCPPLSMQPESACVVIPRYSGGRLRCATRRVE